ncbi:aspartate racemase [Maribacter vaceletii]|uniref:Aspartate racemase n=1 Tax=Maribacter vaceletii TaxID=1206816 RepID=A0A495E932_9FLAO|nr:amino acid racemase [Maribacter vaceletii]RKR13089.1 aspartate racemase [Maribacter vaceletii]
MKTIGLIGGMGWESSKLYYERINKKVNKVLGGSHSAKIIMVSVDFGEIEKLTFRNDWEAISKIIVKSAKQLEKAGADMVVLCTNLIHIVSDEIIRVITIPFIHIATATADAILKKRLKRILLIGTKYTMEKDFYTNTLKEKGLKIVIPNKEDRNIIHNIIYEELLKGVFNDKAKQKILKIIKNTEFVEGVVLACTELPMLIKEKDISIPSFDTGNIHVDKIVKTALGIENTKYIDIKNIAKGICFEKHYLPEEKIEKEWQKLKNKIL